MKKLIIMECQESQTIERLSRERPEGLNVTNVHVFFRDKLNDYEG